MQNGPPASQEGRCVPCCEPRATDTASWPAPPSGAPAAPPPAALADTAICCVVPLLSLAAGIYIECFGLPFGVQ
jgi:hypothetical protein